MGIRNESESASGKEHDMRKASVRILCLAIAVGMLTILSGCSMFKNFESYVCYTEDAVGNARVGDTRVSIDLNGHTSAGVELEAGEGQMVVFEEVAIEWPDSPTGVMFTPVDESEVLFDYKLEGKKLVVYVDEGIGEVYEYSFEDDRTIVFDRPLLGIPGATRFQGTISA